ncbi:MAG TPA: hypothetical protein VKV02_03250 [Acidobacteriaceae bacterium]|nr:hypothetical protein [Acidobacteriaceae bacterium]
MFALTSTSAAVLALFGYGERIAHYSRLAYARRNGRQLTNHDPSGILYLLVALAFAVGSAILVYMRKSESDSRSALFLAFESLLIVLASIFAEGVAVLLIGISVAHWTR